MKICEIDGCGTKHKARGLCHRHYFRLQRRRGLENLPFWDAVPEEIIACITAKPIYPGKGNMKRKEIECGHQDRKHFGKGMCAQCYSKHRYKEFPEKMWRKKYPEKFIIMTRKAHLKERFGMTLEQYDAMVISQDGRCANTGCREMPQKLQLDHDHATGKVRALLCAPCNRALGQVNDKKEKLLGLISYLEKHK